MAGLGLGILGAAIQKSEGEQAQKAFADLQSRVGTLDAIDNDIKARSVELTKLNLLGGAKCGAGNLPELDGRQSRLRSRSGNIKNLFPDADSNGMVWKHFKQSGQYEMAFGRNL